MWKFRFKTFLFIYLYFQVRYVSYVFGYQCGGGLTSKSGVIQSRNFPNLYPNFEFCQWRITTSLIANMTLSFSYFELEGTNSIHTSRCQFDFIEVWSEGVQKSDSRNAIFCGKKFPYKIVVEGKLFYISFQTNDNSVYKGFSATYAIDENECSVRNGDCQHICRNTPFSYRCLCRAGFTLHVNNRGCVEIEDYLERINLGIRSARRKAVQWIQNLRQSNSGNEKWGNQVSRIAIVLYLVDNKYFDAHNTTGNEISYEVDNIVLKNLLRDKTNPISETEMALYIHSLLVTCLNPYNFHGINLVSKLRSSINSQNNYTSPLVMLALCNANDEITKDDIAKVIAAFDHAQRSVWTSTKALAVMALSCMIQRSQSSFLSMSLIKNMSLEIIEQQYGNGSIDNIYTTTMVMQAVFASGLENHTWDEENAVDFLIISQMEDGSYGNFLNTYYAMPALFHKSLINISSSHCKNKLTDTAPIHWNSMKKEIKKQMLVKYSLWFGNHLDIIKSAIIRMKANSTFFDIMRTAESLDPQYTFDYIMSGSKPYVYSLNGFQEDPETEMFWLLYRMSDEDTDFKVINSSPVDIYPKHRDEYIMWYRKGQWNQEIDTLLKDRVILMETQEFENDYGNTSLSKHDETLSEDGKF